MKYIQRELSQQTERNTRKQKSSGGKKDWHQQQEQRQKEEQGKGRCLEFKRELFCTSLLVRMCSGHVRTSSTTTTLAVSPTCVPRVGRPFSWVSFPLYFFTSHDSYTGAWMWMRVRAWALYRSLSLGHISLAHWIKIEGLLPQFFLLPSIYLPSSKHLLWIPQNVRKIG